MNPETEAIDALAGHVSRDVIRDRLRADLDDIAERFRAAGRDFAAGKKGFAVYVTAPAVADLRRLFVARGAVERRLQALEDFTPPEHDTPADEAWALLIEANPGRLRFDLAAEWTGRRDAALKRRDAARQAIQAAAEGYTEGVPAWSHAEHAAACGSPLAHAINRMTDAVEAMADAETILETLQHDPDQTARQAAAVIEGNGGPVRVAQMAKSALMACSRWLESDPSWPAIRDASGRLSEVSAQLTRVEKTSLLGASLKEESAELTARVDNLTTEARGRREAGVKAMVKAAAEGHQAAIDQLLALAREVPRAFPFGFGEAFATVSMRTEAQLRGALSLLLEPSAPSAPMPQPARRETIFEAANAA